MAKEIMYLTHQDGSNNRETSKKIEAEEWYSIIAKIVFYSGFNRQIVQ